MTCPSCQTQNPAGAKFCTNCGASLVGLRPVLGERKLVSMLFADVADSTGLAERLDPEDWATIMNGAFGFMNAAITRYGGTVGRLMGDGVLAFFGAPLAHENDAERAVRAGLELRDLAKAYAEQLRVSHGLTFRVRVGVNTGLAVLTTVGDAALAEYTAMGDAANLAARLQGLAEPGTVLIGPDTYRRVRRLVEVRRHGAVRVKGKALPFDAYEVLGLSPQPAARSELSSPLIGRDAEMARLSGVLANLASGRGALVTLEGEAGMGKSRLLAELRSRSPAGVRWLEGRALSYTQGVLYYPWRQLILASVGAHEAESPEAVRAKLRASFGSALSERDWAFAETVAGLESEASLAALADLGGTELLAGIAEAGRAYALALAQQAPSVLLLEDLHWADPASLELISAIAELTPHAPLLLACALRPERSAPSWALLERARSGLGPAHLHLELKLLAPKEAELLLANLAGDALPEGLRARILEKAEGNPFFVEEVLRTLVESGELLEQDGRWRLARPVAELHIPDTLEGVLGARIDRLPGDAKRLAQTAAVIGRSFAEPVLSAVALRAPAEEQIGDIPAQLGLLEREELLRERAREPELEYSFKHALTQEAAYGRLLMRHRKELHRRAGEVLAERYEGQAEEYAPVLERHFRLGEDWLSAAKYATLAAKRARRLYALSDAQDHLEAALEYLERGPDAPPGTLIDALLGWLEVAVLRRLHEVIPARKLMLARAEQALELARSLGEARRLARALIAKGNVLALSGFPGTGFGPLLEAFDLARELQDEHLALLPYWAATEIMLSRDPKGAAAQSGEVAALAAKVGNKGIEAHALGTKAVAHARLGEFALSREAIARALEVGPNSDSVIKEADVNILVGAAYYDLDEWERGLAHSARGAALAEGVGGLECACGGYHTSGLGRMGVKQLEAANRDLAHALRLGAGTGMDSYLPQVRAAQASAGLLLGDPAALAALEAALAESREVGDDYGVAYALYTLGDALHRLGRSSEAERHLNEALSSYRARGMLPYVARTLRLLAPVQEAAGRSAEAKAALAEADAVSERLAAQAA